MPGNAPVDDSDVDDSDVDDSEGVSASAVTTACGSACIRERDVGGVGDSVARGGSIVGVAPEPGGGSLSELPGVSRSAHTLTTVPDAITPNRTLGESQAGIHKTDEQERHHVVFGRKNAKQAVFLPWRKTDASPTHAHRRED